MIRALARRSWRAIRRRLQAWQDLSIPPDCWPTH